MAGGPAAWAGPGLAASGRGWHAGCAGDCQRAGGRWAWQVGSSAGLGKRLVSSRWAGCLPCRGTVCGQVVGLGWRWRGCSGQAALVVAGRCRLLCANTDVNHMQQSWLAPALRREANDV